MKKTDAIAAFKGVSNLARALSIKPQAVSQWGENVPQLRAYQIQEIINHGKRESQKNLFSRA